MSTYRGPDGPAGQGKLAEYVNRSGDTMTGDLTVPNLYVDGNLQVVGTVDGYNLSDQFDTTLPATYVNVSGDTMTGLLHIQLEDIGFAGPYNARTAAIVEGTHAAGTALSIMAKSTGVSAIYFGDESSESVGQVRYDHTDNKLKFYVSSGDALVLDASLNATFAGDISMTAGKLLRLGDSTSWYQAGADIIRTDDSVVIGANLYFADNSTINIGTANDLKLYHNGSHSFMDNATGDIYLRNFADSRFIGLYTDDSVGTNKAGIFIGGATPKVSLYYDGTEVFNTNSLGVSTTEGYGINVGNAAITSGNPSLYIYGYDTGATASKYLRIFVGADGSSNIIAEDTYLILDAATYVQIQAITNHTESIIVQDNKSLGLGSNLDLQLYHNGTVSYIQNSTGSMYLLESVNSDYIYLQTYDSVGATHTGIRVGGATPAVNLYYDNVSVFETISGGVLLSDNIVQRPEIKDYSITHSAESYAATMDLDYATAQSFSTTLTGNVTTLTFSNPPASGKYGEFVWEVTQDGTGGRTIAWPASVKWVGGTAPSDTTLSTIHQYVFSTRDGGTTWLGKYAEAFA